MPFSRSSLGGSGFGGALGRAKAQILSRRPRIDATTRVGQSSSEETSQKRRRGGTKPSSQKARKPRTPGFRGTGGTSLFGVHRQLATIRSRLSVASQYASQAFFSMSATRSAASAAAHLLRSRLRRAVGDSYCRGIAARSSCIVKSSRSRRSLRESTSRSSSHGGLAAGAAAVAGAAATDPEGSSSRSMLSSKSSSSESSSTPPARSRRSSRAAFIVRANALRIPKGEPD